VRREEAEEGKEGEKEAMFVREEDKKPLLEDGYSNSASSPPSADSLKKAHTR